MENNNKVTNEKDKKKKYGVTQQPFDPSYIANDEQILIEDGTMAAFGFSNPSEIKVNRNK